MTFSIVPAHLAVKAMRDNGYKNAAYALAELMDNSIQAGADTVELLCGEMEFHLGQRRRSRVAQIGILDNGRGMSEEVLRLALQFGNGTHLTSDKQDGIGRFGMGLPASSMSQCKKVEVWTWQRGIDSAMYSLLDLDKIISQEVSNVPEPVQRKVPDTWLSVGKSFGESGTLVVWSQLDRLMWKTSAAIIDNSEFVIGRMYRRFLQDNRVNIRMIGFDLENTSVVTTEKSARPNDPSYFMSGTSCPEPWNDEGMFDKWGGDDFEVVHVIEFEGKNHEVKLRYYMAKEEARSGGRNAGKRPHGQHAARNLGVSIMRADRELDLDAGWTNPSDPRDRWWGVEIDFPPALDELFGVTNNKQSAHNFSELAKMDIEDLLKGGRTITELKEEMVADQDPRAPLIEIAHQIQKSLGVIRGLLRAQTKSEDNANRHQVNESSAEAIATKATQDRVDAGHSGISDIDESLSDDERKGIIEQTLIDEGVPKGVALGIAASTVSNGLKYVFAEAVLETPSFFSVKQRGGSIIITLNTNHAAYPSLVEVLEDEVNGNDHDALKERLSNALVGLKLLLMAWARYEDEQPDGLRRQNVQDARMDWGRIARQFLDV